MIDWRLARPAPLPVTGNLVIEALSPANVIAAMGLGVEHATALPRDIVVKGISVTEGILLNQGQNGQNSIRPYPFSTSNPKFLL